MITKLFGRISTPSNPLLLTIVTMSNPPIIPTPPIIRDSRVTGFSLIWTRINLIQKLGWVTKADDNGRMARMILSNFTYSTGFRTTETSASNSRFYKLLSSIFKVFCDTSPSRSWKSNSYWAILTLWAIFFWKLELYFNWKKFYNRQKSGADTGGVL